MCIKSSYYINKSIIPTWVHVTYFTFRIRRDFQYDSLSSRSSGTSTGSSSDAAGLCHTTVTDTTGQSRRGSWLIMCSGGGNIKLDHIHHTMCTTNIIEICMKVNVDTDMKC